MMTKRICIGDIVMTPTNVQAKVLDATGNGPYDTVEVEEITPERWHNTWRVNQIVVQRSVADQRPCTQRTFVRSAHFNGGSHMQRHRPDAPSVVAESYLVYVVEYAATGEWVCVCLTDEHARAFMDAHPAMRGLRVVAVETWHPAREARFAANDVPPRSGPFGTLNP